MNKFSIKNYSTEISAEKSIAEIEKMLSSFGAEAILKEYQSDGVARALSFKIEGKIFKLPANVNGVKSVLYSGKHRYYGRDTMKKRDDRAYRVAWGIIKDWIHAQLSLIISGQAHPQEIFLPYLFNGKKTLYQAYTEGKLLTGKEKEGGKGERDKGLS